jgi:hypothetical protein
MDAVVIEVIYMVVLKVLESGTQLLDFWYLLLHQKKETYILVPVNTYYLSICMCSLCSLGTCHIELAFHTLWRL